MSITVIKAPKFVMTPEQLALLSEYTQSTVQVETVGFQRTGDPDVDKSQMLEYVSATLSDGHIILKRRIVDAEGNAHAPGEGVSIEQIISSNGNRVTSLEPTGFSGVFNYELDDFHLRSGEPVGITDDQDALKFIEARRDLCKHSWAVFTQGLELGHGTPAPEMTLQFAAKDVSMLDILKNYTLDQVLQSKTQIEGLCPHVAAEILSPENELIYDTFGVEQEDCWTCTLCGTVLAEKIVQISTGQIAPDTDASIVRTAVNRAASHFDLGPPDNRKVVLAFVTASIAPETPPENIAFIYAMCWLTKLSKVKNSGVVPISPKSMNSLNETLYFIFDITKTVYRNDFTNEQLGKLIPLYYSKVVAPKVIKAQATDVSVNPLDVYQRQFMRYSNWNPGQDPKQAKIDTLPEFKDYLAASLSTALAETRGEALTYTFMHRQPDFLEPYVLEHPDVQAKLFMLFCPDGKKHAPGKYVFTFGAKQVIIDAKEIRDSLEVTNGQCSSFVCSKCNLDVSLEPDVDYKNLLLAIGTANALYDKNKYICPVDHTKHTGRCSKCGYDPNAALPARVEYVKKLPKPDVVYTETQDYPEVPVSEPVDIKALESFEYKNGLKYPDISNFTLITTLLDAYKQMLGHVQNGSIPLVYRYTDDDVLYVKSQVYKLIQANASLTKKLVDILQNAFVVKGPVIAGLEYDEGPEDSAADTSDLSLEEYDVEDVAQVWEVD